MKRRISILNGTRLTGRHPERAMTLLEILVSVGVMVAILGIAYGMVIESERSSQKIDQRESAMVYCQRVIDRVSTVLRSAVPPADLAGEPAAVAPLFESNQLSVMVLDSQATAGMARVTITLDPDGRKGAGTILHRVDPMDGGAEGALEDDFYPAISADSKVHLEFGYAGSQAPDALANYQPTWPAGEWPTLVRIRVSVEAGDEPGDTVEFEAAVIPAMVPQLILPTPIPEPVSEVVIGQPTNGAVILDALSTTSQEVTQ